MFSAVISVMNLCFMPLFLKSINALFMGSATVKITDGQAESTKASCFFYHRKAP
jgi:hypothetical protein